jgi:predicted nucleic acid-binding protein
VIVVADTAVLVNLCRVGQGALFKSLFQEVIVPPEVIAEFVRLTMVSPRFKGLTMPEGIREQSPTIISSVVQSSEGLDAGEAAALSLAVEIHADAVLLDERRGYEVALQLGLHSIGVLGILIQAKKAGLIVSVKPVIASLERDAGFWISEGLRKKVLQVVGEHF